MTTVLVPTPVPTTGPINFDTVVDFDVLAAIQTTLLDGSIVPATVSEQGSGITIGNGYILTAAHVIGRSEGTTSLNPVFSQNNLLNLDFNLASNSNEEVTGFTNPNVVPTTSNVSINNIGEYNGLQAQTGNDIALVQTSTTTPTNRIIVFSDPNEAQGDLFSAGFPNFAGGETLHQTQGTLSIDSYQVNPINGRLADNFVIFPNADFDINPGQSGSGVFLNSTTTGSSQNFLFALVSQVGALEPIGDSYHDIADAIFGEGTTANPFTGVDPINFARNVLVADLDGNVSTTIEGTGFNEDIYTNVNYTNPALATTSLQVNAEGGNDNIFISQLTENINIVGGEDRVDINDNTTDVTTDRVIIDAAVTQMTGFGRISTGEEQGEIRLNGVTIVEYSEIENLSVRDATGNITTLALDLSNPLTLFAELTDGVTQLQNGFTNAIQFNSGQGDVVTSTPTTNLLPIFSLLTGLDLNFEVVPATLFSESVTLESFLADSAIGQPVTDTTISFGDGIASDEVTQMVDGNDLTLLVNDDGVESSLTLEGAVNADGTTSISSVNFADGTSLTVEDIPLAVIDTPEPEPILLDGTTGNDTLIGGDGNDTINGGAGDDTILTGTGFDIVNAGSGDDIIAVNSGSFGGIIDGGAGNDTLIIEASNVNFGSDIGGGATIVSFTNDDGTSGSVEFVNIQDVFFGGALPPVPNAINGDSANNRLVGTSEDDVINGASGNDVIISGAANDRLDGGAGDDLLRGNDGDDIVLGGNGNDTLFGGFGDDLLDGGEGADSLNGGQGIDTVDYSGSDTIGVIIDLNTNTALRGDADGDTLISIENLIGTGFGDSFAGNSDDNIFFGLDGVDRLVGGAGDDRLDGGTGDDIVRGNDGDDTVFGGDGDDIVFGGFGEDNINGGTGIDTLLGGTGNDIIDGRGGFDTLNGGTGDDVLTGGFNADTFIFEDGFGNDTISDFASTSNAERIDLSAVSEFIDFADLTANHLTQSGADTIIDDGAGNTITLTGVNLTDLDAIDFVF